MNLFQLHRAARLVLACGLLVVASGCGLLAAPAVPPATPEPSPTLLPPPRPISSPDPSGPSSLASPSPAAEAPKPGGAPPTTVPPPNLNPAPAGAPSGARAKVANTEGQGANMRAEPSPTGALVRTVREGVELELIGPEREGGDRTWRNVRDPASGATGWIVSELLEVAAAGQAPAAAPAPEAKPAGEAKPSGEPKPVGEPKPSGEPKPGAQPKPAASPGAALQPAGRLGEADRAYLAVLQEQVEVLGNAISAANQQIERAGGSADTMADPGWRQETQGVARSFADAAAQIRAVTPGPATGEVHKFASNAADRADETAGGLIAASDARDPRGLPPVRTTMVRLLGEINNMNLALLDLQ